jgi:Uma2 family endonuclease
MLLGVRLTTGCRYYSPDQRFWIGVSTRGRYSDGSIIRGRPEHPPHDEQATTNPVVVMEVLSPFTEGDREGMSFELPTLTRPMEVAEIYADILDAAGRSLLG